MYRRVERVGVESVSVSVSAPWNASFTMQHNLVPDARQRCPTAGKVTVGFTSHWSCVIDLSGL